VIQIAISDRTVNTFLQAAQEQEMFNFTTLKESDWLLRTLFTGSRDMKIKTESMKDVLPQLSQMYPGKNVEIRALVTDPRVTFLKKRSGNILLTIPVTFEFEVELSERASMHVLSFSSELKLVLDATVHKGLLFLAILDIGAENVVLEEDRVELKAGLEMFLDEFNSRLVWELNDLDKNTLKEGLDVKKYIPSYFRVENTYFDGHVLAELSFK